MSRDVWRRSARRGSPPFLSITPTRTTPSGGSSRTLSAFRTGKIITVFGCGGDRDRGKRPLMGEAASALSDLAIVTSDNPRTEDPLAIIREIETGIRTTRFADAGDLAQPSGRAGLSRHSRPERGDRHGDRSGRKRRHRPDRREGSRGLPDHRHTEASLRRPGDRPGRAGTLASREGRIMTDDTPVLSAGEILKATGGAPLRGGTEWSCRGISTDTRTLRRGEPLHRPSGGKLRRPRLPRRGRPKGRLRAPHPDGELRESGQPAKGAAGHRRPGHPGGAGGNRPCLAAAIPDPARRDHGEFGKDHDEGDARGDRLADRGTS